MRDNNDKRDPDRINAESAQMLSFGVFVVLLTIAAAILKNLVF